MHEIEIRKECINCDGYGGFYNHVIRAVENCYLCNGTGLGSFDEIKSVEIDND